METPGLNWPGLLPRILWMRRQCPLCGSIQFQPAEPETLDGPLGLFGLGPVRCVNCRRRYYWFAVR
jgi:hypothetical protein